MQTSTSRGSPVTRSVSSADSVTFACPAIWLWIMKTTVWNALVRLGTGQFYSPLGAVRRNLACGLHMSGPGLQQTPTPVGLTGHQVGVDAGGLAGIGMAHPPAHVRERDPLGQQGAGEGMP